MGHFCLLFENVIEKSLAALKMGPFVKAVPVAFGNTVTNSPVWNYIRVLLSCHHFKNRGFEAAAAPLGEVKPGEGCAYLDAHMEFCQVPALGDPPYRVYLPSTLGS